MADQDQVVLSPLSGGRVRPRGSRRELLVWLIIRVSGVTLFVLALAHFSIMHFIWDPAEQTSEFIANERWNQIVWRGFDWLLLMNVLFHGFLGVRTVVLDYVRRPRWSSSSAPRSC
jgi:succinate dehydrogenase / fumarate reductase membrane anchor subunit